MTDYEDLIAALKRVQNLEERVTSVTALWGETRCGGDFFDVVLESGWRLVMRYRHHDVRYLISATSPEGERVYDTSQYDEGDYSWLDGPVEQAFDCSLAWMPESVGMTTEELRQAIEKDETR
jgi:hypothetical protein